MPDIIRRYDKQIMSFLLACALALGGWAWSAEARLQTISTAVKIEKEYTQAALFRIEAKLDSINDYLRDKQ